MLMQISVFHASFCREQEEEDDTEDWGWAANMAAPSPLMILYSKVFIGPILLLPCSRLAGTT